MASRPHTNPRLLAQASHIPWATSYLRFDYGRPPSRTNVLLCCLSALYPDVAQIIKGKPVSSTGVMTTSVADATRKCSSIIIAALVPEKKKRKRIEPDMHTQPVGRAHIYFKHTEAIFRGWYKDYILNSINPSGNKKKKDLYNTEVKSKGLCSKCTRTPPQNKVIKCAPMIEPNPWEAQNSTIPATEVSNRTATSSFQKPLALPACWHIPLESAALCSAVWKSWGCKAPLWDRNPSFVWAGEWGSPS